MYGERADRRARDQARVYTRRGEPHRRGDRTQGLERMTEDAVLRIGELRGGRANLVRGGIVDDDGRVTNRVVHLVVKQ